jgi:hypothetical protein
MALFEPLTNSASLAGLSATCRPPVVLEVKMAERLTVLVADDVAGVLHLLDGPRWREAASKLFTPHHPIRDKGSDKFLGSFR